MLEPLLADEASFDDGTAYYLFGNQRTEGKAAMMHKFRTEYVGILKLEFEPSRTFHSGNIAIYEGNLDWAVSLQSGEIIDTVMPIVTILQVEDGKIVSHRDFGDYGAFVAEVERLRSKQAE